MIFENPGNLSGLRGTCCRADPEPAGRHCDHNSARGGSAFVRRRTWQTRGTCARRSTRTHRVVPTPFRNHPRMDGPPASVTHPRTRLDTVRQREEGCVTSGNSEAASNASELPTVTQSSTPESGSPRRVTLRRKLSPQIVGGRSDALEVVKSDSGSCCSDARRPARQWYNPHEAQPAPKISDLYDLSDFRRIAAALVDIAKDVSANRPSEAVPRNRPFTPGDGVDIQTGGEHAQSGNRERSAAGP